MVDHMPVSPQNKTSISVSSLVFERPAFCRIPKN